MMDKAKDAAKNVSDKQIEQARDEGGFAWPWLMGQFARAMGAVDGPKLAP